MAKNKFIQAWLDKRQGSTPKVNRPSDKPKAQTPSAAPTPKPKAFDESDTSPPRESSRRETPKKKDE